MTTTKTKPVRVRVPDARPLIASRTPFVAGTMSGAYLTAGTCGAGELPDEWRPAWSDAVKRYGRRLFVVRSFETPIGWRGDDGQTVIPDVPYGSRTARHQTEVRVAWDSHATTLPGEMPVRVVMLTDPSRFRVFGPHGSRTFPFDYEAPLSGKFESAAREYGRKFLGHEDFRVIERHSRFRGRRFVILPD